MLYQVSAHNPSNHPLSGPVVNSSQNSQQGESSIETRPRQKRLPPSARKIYAVFDDQQPHTVQDLRKKTGFSIRCTRYAVQLLKESHLIIAKFNFKDARQPLYQKVGESGQPQALSHAGYVPVPAL